MYEYKKRKLQIYEKWENIIFFVDVIILNESSERTLDMSWNNKGKVPSSWQHVDIK